MNGILESMPIVQCAALEDTIDEGKIIITMSQYAQCLDGKTIHSKNQLEHFGCRVLDTSQWHGGCQPVYT